MATTWIVVSWVTGTLLVVDQQRRSAAAWAAADRDRGWWTTMTVIGSFFALGLAFAGAYAVLVVPRFASGDGVADQFRKRSRP